MYLSVLVFPLNTTKSFAQEAEETVTDSEEAVLAKATQNPLATMYSLPFQNNTTYGIGKYKRARNVVNIQPVIPVSFSLSDLASRIQLQFLFPKK